MSYFRKMLYLSASVIILTQAAETSAADLIPSTVLRK